MVFLINAASTEVTLVTKLNQPKKSRVWITDVTANTIKNVSTHLTAIFGNKDWEICISP